MVYHYHANTIMGVVLSISNFYLYKFMFLLQLLGGEVYHYHGKVISKEPKEGGQHVWHQDYGYAHTIYVVNVICSWSFSQSNTFVLWSFVWLFRYWYQFGCLSPDMGTLWIAVDKTNQENGCVHVPIHVCICTECKHRIKYLSPKDITTITTIYKKYWLRWFYLLLLYTLCHIPNPDRAKGRV